jgi:hypothetical protein
MASSKKIEFGDAGTYVHQQADGALDIVSDGNIDLAVGAAGVIVRGTTPKVTIGDAGAEDTFLVFDGNAQDYRIGLDDGTDILEFGVGASHGTTISMKMDASLNVDIAGHNTSVGLKLGGTLVSATAAELNYSDLTALGTSEASKVVSADASGDITIAGAAANMVWDKSEDALEFADNASIEIGTGLDMKLYHDGTNSYITNAVGALKLATETSGIAVTIGHSTSEVTVADNLTVAGNLIVTGTTVTSSVEVISTSSGVLFEGGTDDGHEATLKSAVAGADVTYTLPNLTGHIPLLAGAASAADVTYAEFALLDGGSSVATVTVADGDGVLFNDAGTMKQITVQSLAAYYDDEITAMPNLVTTAATTVGTIGSGVWQGTVVASAYLDADTAHLTATQTFTGAKTFTADVTAGVDGTGVDVKFFGDTAGAYGLWDQSADKLIVRGPVGTGTATPGVMRLETAELTVVDGDQLGRIEFIAPLESAGTDAITLAASIWAEADDTFAADNNDTDLVFATGKSAAATEKMRLNSDGDLNTAGKITAVGSFIIGSADMSEADLEKLDGITNGTAAASKAVVLDGSLDVSGVNALGIASMASNWTNAGRTVADMGILTTVDINGGSIDGAVIGAASVAAGSFAAVVGTTGTFSGVLKTDDNTAATSTTDGSLQTDGGLSVALDAVVGDDLILLSDAAVIHFGASKEVTLTHVADKGLTVTHTGAGDNLPVVFQLKSEEDAVIADEVIASIEFAAGDSDGSDGALVAAGIHAIAEETFAADANATKLVFTAADSETAASSATAKMTLASTGNLTTAGSITAVGSFIIGSADMSEADLEKLDGITNGTGAASKALVLDGSRDVDTINALGIASMANNWTNAGRTVADMGILTTVDINGGSVDGTIIGAASVAAGSFAAVVCTTGTYSGAVSAAHLASAGRVAISGQSNDDDEQRVVFYKADGTLGNADQDTLAEVIATVGVWDATSNELVISGIVENVDVTAAAGSVARGDVLYLADDGKVSDDAGASIHFPVGIAHAANTGTPGVSAQVTMWVKLMDHTVIG